MKVLLGVFIVLTATATEHSRSPHKEGGGKATKDSSSSSLINVAVDGNTTNKVNLLKVDLLKVDLLNNAAAALLVGNIPSSLAPFDGEVTCNLFNGYPSVCGNLTGCAYCCASQECLELDDDDSSNGAESSNIFEGVQVPTTTPLPSPSSSSNNRVWTGPYASFKHNKTCPIPAVLPEDSLNCDVTCFNGTLDLEDSKAELCSECLSKPWCLYCGGSAPMCLHTSSAICPQTMQKNCADHGSVPRDQSFVDKVIPYLVLICIIVGLLVIILPIGRYLYTKIQQKLEQRRDIRRREEFRAQQRRREEEQQEQQRQRSETEGSSSSTRPEQNTNSTPAATANPPPTRPVEETGDEGDNNTVEDQAVERSSETGTTVSNSRELSERQPLLSASSTVVVEGDKQKDENSSPTTNTTTSPPPVVPSMASLSDEETCQLCLDARATIVYFPCYHCYCCEDCSSKLRPSGNRREGYYYSCPFCRQRVRAMVNVEPLPEIIKNSLRQKRQE